MTSHSPPTRSLAASAVDAYVDRLPSPVVQSVPALMTEEDYNLLQEILSRAQSILRSSPSADNTLSFLRLLSAYDQILLRHDIAATNDTSVFQWLVTLNIQTDEEAKQEREAGGTSNHSKEYSSWVKKLNQLFEMSQLQRKNMLLFQPQRRDLSIESLDSNASSFANHTHITFPSNLTAPSHLRTSTGAGVLKNSLRGLDQYDLVDEKDHAHTNDEKYDDDNVSHDSNDSSDQIFLDLLKQNKKSSKEGIDSKGRHTSADVRLIRAFDAWHRMVSPNPHIQKLFRQQQQTVQSHLRRSYWQNWKETLELARYQRYLKSLLHVYNLGIIKHLLSVWRHETAKRQYDRQQAQSTTLGSAYRHWRSMYAQSRVSKQMGFIAARGGRVLRWKYAVIAWARFVQRRKVNRARLAQMDAIYASKLMPAVWTHWCQIRTMNSQYLIQSKAHLKRLRLHQSVLYWLKWTRLRQTPSHRSTLSITQFHILWRWLNYSFGNGYEIMRIIWLSKMKYQQAFAQKMTPDEFTQEQRRRKRNNEPGLQVPHPSPLTHPFVAGPAVLTSFAATAAAPFSQSTSAAAAARQQDLSQSEYRSYDYAASSSFNHPLSTSGPTLGAPVSHLDVPAAPHIDTNLPMQHAILQLLNRCLLFRRHKLGPLMDMIQIWAKWYMKHLFRHWRANSHLKKQQRYEEQKRIAEQLAEQETAKGKVERLRANNLLQQAFDTWQDSFHKSTYYTLLLRNLYARQHRRLLSDQFQAWKFAFVSLRARKLFRLRRGIAAWKRCIKREHKLRRKFGIVQFTHRRTKLEHYWAAWRLAAHREVSTKHGMLAMLWQKWKDQFTLSLQRKRDARDADIYYRLKLAMKTLLTWRALSITRSIEHKYIHRAVHHYHSALSHRHIVWWVNWKRYRVDSKRLAVYGKQVYLNKLKFAAVKMWRENATSRTYRHTKLRQCRTVRNKFLASAALRTWRYALLCRVKAHRIRNMVELHAQKQAWLTWLDSIRLKNLQYESLESHVMVRRDFNTMGHIFHNWYDCSLEIRRARRLAAHCETVWYYALVKRLFLSWRNGAHFIRKDHNQKVRSFEEQQRAWSQRKRAIRSWRILVHHQQRYHTIIHAARHQLSTRYEIAFYLRLWRKVYVRERSCKRFSQTHHGKYLLNKHWTEWRSQLADIREVQQKIRYVFQKQGRHLLRYTMEKWTKQYMPFNKMRKAKLNAVCSKLRLIYMRLALKEWKLYRTEARLQVPAIAFSKRSMIASCFHGWREVFSESRRAKRADAWASNYDARKTTAMIYRCWKAAVRTAHIHQLFLYKKTFLAWKRYVRLQKHHKRIAVDFKDNFHIRRMRFMFKVWQRFGRMFYAKQKRKLVEKQKASLFANHQNRIRLWAHWSLARSAARRKILAIRELDANCTKRRFFRNWFDMLQAQLHGKALVSFAAKSFKENSLSKAVRMWRGQTVYYRAVRTASKEASAGYLGSLLVRTYRAWGEKQQIRRRNFVWGIKHIETPRLARLWQAWKAAAGRHGQILMMHQRYLSETLRTWHANARSSFRERYQYPLADRTYNTKLKTLVLHHWHKYQIVHHGYRILRPQVVIRAKSEIFAHWCAMFRLQMRMHEFRERMHDTTGKRGRKHAIKRWLGVIARKKQRQEQEAYVAAMRLQRCAARAYVAWRYALGGQRALEAKANQYFFMGPCRRVASATYKAWRTHFLYLVESHRIQQRGMAHEIQVTNPRKFLAAFQQWKDIAIYHSQVITASSAISYRFETKVKRKVFYSWHIAFRKLIGTRRMDRLKSHNLLRQSIAVWQREADLIKRHELASLCNALYCKKAHLAVWWFHMKKRQKERVAVQLLQSRIKVHSAHSDAWFHAKQIVIPLLKQFLSAESCRAFYFRVWRAYNKHCKSYRDAYDVADAHYSRSVLLPSSWKEWKRTTLESQQLRKARACRVKYAKKRFLANLQKMLQRKFVHLKYCAQADEHERRRCQKACYVEWRRETLRILEERAIAIRECKQKFFDRWYDKFRFNRLMAERTELATKIYEANCVRRAHAHWKSYWLYLVGLESRSALFNVKLDEWHKARLFTAWVERYRRKLWRRQRTRLILQAVRSLWQKNAFLAWNEYVRAVSNQRRNFVLSRVMYAWKFITKRERSRRAQHDEDEQLMKEMEIARINAMPPHLREAHEAARLARLARERQAQDRLESQTEFNPTAADVWSNEPASVALASPRHVPMSTAELDETVAVAPLSARLPPSIPPSLPPSLPPSAPASPAMPPLPLMERVVFPRLNFPDQQWRLTPIRSEDSFLAGSTIQPDGHQASLNGRVNTRGSPSRRNNDRIMEKLQSFDASSSPQLHASLSAAASTNSAVIAPATSSTSALRSLSSSPRKTPAKESGLVSPRSAARRRQDARDAAEQARRAKQAQDAIMQTRSPASNSFVNKLFAN